jgi:hypothetical protein
MLTIAVGVSDDWISVLQATGKKQMRIKVRTKVTPGRFIGRSTNGLSVTLWPREYV